MPSGSEPEGRGGGGDRLSIKRRYHLVTPPERDKTTMVSMIGSRHEIDRRQISGGRRPQRRRGYVAYPNQS